MSGVSNAGQKRDHKLAIGGALFVVAAGGALAWHFSQKKGGEETEEPVAGKGGEGGDTDTSDVDPTGTGEIDTNDNNSNLDQTTTSAPKNEEGGGVDLINVRNGVIATVVTLFAGAFLYFLERGRVGTLERDRFRLLSRSGRTAGRGLGAGASGLRYLGGLGADGFRATRDLVQRRYRIVAGSLIVLGLILIAIAFGGSYDENTITKEALWITGAILLSPAALYLFLYGGRASAKVVGRAVYDTAIALDNASNEAYNKIIFGKGKSPGKKNDRQLEGSILGLTNEVNRRLEYLQGELGEAEREEIEGARDWWQERLQSHVEEAQKRGIDVSTIR